jgi:predicted acetyltransferase
MRPPLALNLIWPSLALVPSYVDALKRGWSPESERGAAATEETLAAIERDAAAYVSGLVDRDATGADIPLPDGTSVRRLPGYVRWLWDGEFCGLIGFRWQRGTEALPAYCLGHIGYTVVPWKQRRGYATEALRLLLPDAKAEGLRYVEITTDVGNAASQRVIEANGGVLVARFTKPPSHGGAEALRFRIALT